MSLDPNRKVTLFDEDGNPVDAATQATLVAVKSVLDAIKTKTDNFDVTLSTRGSEATLAAIKAQTDKLAFIVDRLKVDAEVSVVPVPRPGLAVSEFLKSAGSSAMNVDGSVTPVTFSAAPPTGKKWFIHSITLILEDASINFKKFGGIPGGIANGIDIKVKEGGLAERSLGNFKTNGDLHVFTISVRIDSAATDLLTLQANVKISSGTTFEFKNADSDTFKVIVNDDLTSIDRFNVIIRGFEVDE